MVSFGTLFNNISIDRVRENGTKQTINVPISYGPKERWLARITQDPDLSRDISIVLPRISYEMLSTVYAPDRKLNTMQRLTLPSFTDSGRAMSEYASVPYDFSFTLSIMTRNNADASAIVEQILPYFTPEFTLTIKNMTAIGVDVDTPIILNSVNKEDLFEGAFEDRRAIIWTLDFTLKGLFYGPIKDSTIIKRAAVDFFNTTGKSVLTGNASSDGTGLNINQLQLDKSALLVDNIYRMGKITIGDGPATGDIRTISNYNGTDRVITVGSNFSALPNTMSTYTLEYLTPLSPSDAITDAEMSGAQVMSRVTVEPGKHFETGLPTTVRALSVNIADISANDDFGFVTTIQPANTSGGIDLLDSPFDDPFGG